MALTKEDVDELRDIYEKEAGHTLADDEAWEMATRLLEFGVLLTQEGDCADRFAPSGD